jgi:hypothetical protein
MERDARGVLALAERLTALNQEHETFVGIQEAVIFRGWVTLRSNQMESLERVVNSLERLDAARHWVMLPFFMISIAEAIGGHGQRVRALSLLERAAQVVDMTEERWAEPELIRLEARFRTNKPSEAARLLETALEKAKCQGAKLWQLRTAVDLAKIWSDEGDVAAARGVLGAVYAEFTEGLDTLELVAARAALDSLGASGRVAAHGV